MNLRTPSRPPPNRAVPRAHAPPSARLLNTNERMSAPPPPPDTSIRSVSIVEQIVVSVGPWSRLAIAERALRRALELATPAGHSLDAVTIAAINGVLDRVRAARLASPAEPTAARPPVGTLSIKAAQKPAESALVGAALALLQTLDAAPRARTSRTDDNACTGAAQRCIERTLPLVIPQLIEAWAALRADARRLAPIDPAHAPAPPPITDQTLGPLW